jgi:hypothetical protein
MNVLVGGLACARLEDIRFAEILIIGDVENVEDCEWADDDGHPGRGSFSTLVVWV